MLFIRRTSPAKAQRREEENRKEIERCLSFAVFLCAFAPLREIFF
jgi:hypothetical protein